MWSETNTIDITTKKQPFQPIPFINRISEQKYINDYLTDTPSSILFIYWPKSTWKTTLIKKVLNNLDHSIYDIQYINMREILLTSFTDFKNLFFPKDLMWKWKILPKKFSINSKIPMWWEFGFLWDKEDENVLERDVFQLMIRKITQLNEKWIKPVIILDEFQYLKNIIIEKDIRSWEKKDIELVEELFKFFISITKQNNQAYVVCLTSDSYYIEELYHHAKLKNTSKYYLVDHLEKKDIEKWLWEDEKLNKEIVEYFWENLWGSVWEIWQGLMDYKNTLDYKTWVEKLIKDEYAKIFDLLKFKKIFTEEEKTVFKEISLKIAKNWYYITIDWDWVDFDLIKKLVDIDIWFYNAVEQKITANSQTVRKAFEKMFF